MTVTQEVNNNILGMFLVPSSSVPTQYESRNTEDVCCVQLLETKFYRIYKE